MTSTHVHLVMDAASLVVAVRPTGAEVVYFGARLGEVPQADLTSLGDWPAPGGGFDILPPIALLPEGSRGYQGAPGVSGRRADGAGAFTQFGPPTHEVNGSTLTIRASDQLAGLESAVTIEADSVSSLVTIRSLITNTSTSRYELDGVLLTVPISPEATEVLTLGGRWAAESWPERQDWRAGTIVLENRSGRTSFDRKPFIAAGSNGFAEESGQVWAAHLAWSGNAVLRAEVLRDGRRVIQAGELLLPGEVVLEGGDSYHAPAVHLATSGRGLNGISAAFHAHVRAREIHPQRPRPVGLNTWEAVYFDHDLDTLKDLADRASQVGVERFILDDGWFHGRRNDRVGLGDWWVDRDVWPDGLAPLVDHVTGLGMEFGLWFEPEMVNPDSELFRAHPDWALVTPGHDQAMFRNQLVLDLANPEVLTYLLDQINAVLGTYDIAYVKWDSNRDLSAPQHAGRASVRAQVQAIYRLMDAVREANPDIEIESCASGGARVDLGVVEHVDRFWASDCNDPLDRQHIQRGFSYLVPPELMGAHIGPPTAHTTGRTHSLGFRATTALFGHLGVEWNILDASDSDLEKLADAITLHKRLRPLLHSGHVHRFDHPDPAIMAHGVISSDRSHAVVSVAQIDTSRALPTGRLRIGNLDPDGRYELTPIRVSGTEWGKARVQPEWIQVETLQLSGRQLAHAGVPLPVLHPESAFLVELVRV
ncbi:MAG: alpha-galactosidase [Acidimicrobiales bacterium]